MPDEAFNEVDHQIASVINAVSMAAEEQRRQRAYEMRANGGRPDPAAIERARKINQKVRERNAKQVFRRVRKGRWLDKATKEQAAEAYALARSFADRDDTAAGVMEIIADHAQQKWDLDLAARYDRAAAQPQRQHSASPATPAPRLSPPGALTAEVGSLDRNRAWDYWLGLLQQIEGEAPEVIEAWQQARTEADEARHESHDADQQSRWSQESLDQADREDTISLDRHDLDQHPDARQSPDGDEHLRRDDLAREDRQWSESSALDADFAGEREDRAWDTKERRAQLANDVSRHVDAEAGHAASVGSLGRVAPAHEGTSRGRRRRTNNPTSTGVMRRARRQHNRNNKDLDRTLTPRR